jgi:hypothetical protein
MNCFTKTMLTLGIMTVCQNAVAFSPDCPAFPHYKPTNGPLALMNCDFHLQYQKHIDDMVKTFGAPFGRPVILDLGGTFVLKYNGQTEKVRVIPDSYHDMKTFGHALFSIYLVLSPESQGPLRDETKITLSGIKSHIEQSEAVLSTLELTPDEATLTRKLADAARQFLNQTLADNAYSPEKLRKFYDSTAATLDEVIMAAAKNELTLAEKTVDAWLNRMSPDEKSRLAIVVATVHQARARGLSLQYFEKKFGFHAGEGAQNENGFVVLESTFSEKEALEQLAKHYIDREAAGMILHDPERLQRDLLADATGRILNSKNITGDAAGYGSARSH